MRQTMDHFREYAAAFAKMLLSESASQHLSEFDIRLYANRDTLTHVQDEAMAAKRYFLRPESQEQDQFRASLTEWSNRGVRTWTSLLKGEEAVTEDYRRIFEQIHKRFAFEVIVTLGDNGAASAFAQSAGLDHVVLDFSLRDPCLFDSALFDPLGMGGRSSLAHVDISAIRAFVGKDTWPPELDQAYLSDFGRAHVHRDSLGSIDFTGQDRILRRGNGRAAFLCLQNFDDLLFRAHSAFETPAHLLETCVPELADNNILTIVRPPQGDVSGPGQEEALNEARRCLSAYSDAVLWLDRQNERISDTRLYTLCDLVITANGASGMEAALFGKQICVLGNASYKPKGAFPTLDAAVSRHFDNRTYQRNLSALRALLLRSKLVARQDLFSFEMFTSRLVQTLETWHDTHRSPRLALEETYGRYAPATTETLKARLTRSAAEAAPQVDHEEAAERSRTQTMKAWNKSVSSLTNRARQSIGRKILQAGLAGSAPLGSLASNPLFSDHSDTSAASAVGLPTYPVAEEDQHIMAAARATLHKRRKTRSTFAIVAHCFYRDMTERLVERLQTIDHKFDLFASIPPFGGEEIKNLIRNAFPTSKIVALSNRGGDIWPFCFILAEMESDKYAYVLKLHTAKPHYEAGEISTDVGQAWFDYCLACLLGQPGNDSLINEFAQGQAGCSLAGPQGLLRTSKGDALNLAFDAAQALAGLDLEQVPNHWTYFSDGMYWIDFNVLNPLLPVFSHLEHYSPGTISPTCQMRELADYAFALAAHQSSKPLSTLVPGISRPIRTPLPDQDSLNDTLRAFLTA